VRFDAGEQLAHPERLGDEVRGPEAEGPHRGVLGGHRRDHENRELAEAFVLLQALEQLQPVDLGHHDVEQQQGRLGLLQLGEQAFAPGAHGHLVAVLLEDPRQRLDQ